MESVKIFILAEGLSFFYHYQVERAVWMCVCVRTCVRVCVCMCMHRLDRSTMDQTLCTANL